MNAVDRLREARKQCVLAADGDDLTEMQRETAGHLAGILNQLADSVVAYQDELVVRADGSGDDTPTGSYLPAETVDDDLRTDGGLTTTERASVRLHERDDSERVPWCPDCECFAVPDDGACGDCGSSIVWREGSA